MIHFVTYLGNTWARAKSHSLRMTEGQNRPKKSNQVPNKVTGQIRLLHALNVSHFYGNAAESLKGRKSVLNDSETLNDP